MNEHEARRAAKAAVGQVEGFRLILSTHAKIRMRERNVTDVRVRSVLRSGDIIEGPSPSLGHDGWECAFYGAADGGLKVVAGFGKTADGMDVVVVTVVV